MKLITESNYKEQMKNVMDVLDCLRKPGTFARKPGEDIYYELYPVENSLGWMVISHGFTESIVKFYEVIWYLTQAGYSVAMPEHRGHGRSFRDVEPEWVTNVDDFTDYRDDMIYFIREIVVPQLDGKPLFVMGHSMGGAIVTHVAEYATDLPVEKYILCSPMIAPETGGLPEGISRLISDLSIRHGKGREPIFVASAFNPEEKFDPDGGCSTSEARFYWYHEICCQHPEFQNSGCTYNWIREAINQTAWVLDPENALQVEVPVLLLQASKDNMVKNEAQDHLVELLPNVRKVCFPAAKHEIFRCTDIEVKQFMNLILNFIK